MAATIEGKIGSRGFPAYSLLEARAARVIASLQEYPSFGFVP